MAGRVPGALIAAGAGLLAVSATAAPPTPAPARPAPAAASSDPFAGARFSRVTGAGGVPLNVVEIGDPRRPPILLIHGYRQSYLSWMRQFGSTLAQQCHLVAFDLRGHGNSGDPWSPAAYDSARPWGEDVERVIRAKGLKAPLIVGWSFGGNVAMDFARTYPHEPVSGYVLVSTSAGMFRFPKPDPSAPPSPADSPDLAVSLAAAEASTALVYGRGLDPALHAELLGAALRVRPFVDAGLARRWNSDNRDLLPRLHAPVTLVFGGRDPVVGPDRARSLVALFKGARVETFPNAGHAVFFDAPERFNALLEALQCRAASAAGR